MHDLIKKEKLSDLICSYHGVSSAAVPVSFLIQGLFLLSDQTWKNSSIKICFFSLSWEVSFWEMVYLYCDWGDICHQVVTKQSFPGTRGDCTKSAAAEESEKMIEAGWKPGTPQQSWGQSSLKTPLTDLVDAVTVTSVLEFHWVRWCSGGIWILNWRSWLSLEISQWEKDWVFQIQTLGTVSVL